jgi:hypothetical protein
MAIEVAGGRLIVVTTNEYRVRDQPNGVPQPIALNEMVCYRGGTVEWRRSYRGWAPANLRFDPGTGLLFEAGWHGIDITDPVSGRCLARVQGFRYDVHGWRQDRTCLPDVQDGVMYVLAERGRVQALRLPVQPPQPVVDEKG